jgi:hypothetical protein
VTKSGQLTVGGHQRAHLIYCILIALNAADVSARLRINRLLVSFVALTFPALSAG